MKKNSLYKINNKKNFFYYFIKNNALGVKFIHSILNRCTTWILKLIFTGLLWLYFKKKKDKNYIILDTFVSKYKKKLLWIIILL